MKLQLFRHLWGVNQPWETVFPQFRQFGYKGIECPPPPEADRARFADLLKQHGFRYIAMAFTSGKSVQEHLDVLARSLEAAAKLGAMQVTVHSGCDWWSQAEASRFYGEALKVQASVGLPVAHETHRVRYFFTPWNTAAMLKEHPALRLCCDFSHWVVACERFLDDQLEAVQLAARHALHIHARVGYAEGPQTPDPSAPEYRTALETHERWWDWMWDAAQAEGRAAISLTPEFGPPGYMHTLPHTNVPVADLATVCDWMANRQRHRFAERSR